MSIHVETHQLFHTLQDVTIPASGEFGYVFAVAETEEMALVKSHDGKNAAWYHYDELAAMTVPA